MIPVGDNRTLERGTRTGQWLLCDNIRVIARFSDQELSELGTAISEALNTPPSGEYTTRTT